MKLTQTQLKKIRKILTQYDARKAEIFGSFARGDATNDSDLDILVDLKGKKTLFDLAGLKLDLEDHLNMSVDVVTYRSVNPRVKPYIMKNRVTVI